MIRFLSIVTTILLCSLFFISCNRNDAPKVSPAVETATTSIIEKPEYFLLRPEVEKAYGYSHAVKISGAVSMDDKGIPTANGDLLQQMKNCYSDLDKILKHFGCTFDDVTVENILTTNMPEFLKQSAYRNSIYKKQFPTGSWFGVKELALPEFMIEIELEVYKAN
jgi:enamine deaminase RidA (YjgF/YER057c/UK114 family)